MTTQIPTIKDPATAGGVQTPLVLQSTTDNDFQPNDETPLLADGPARPPSRASTTASRLRNNTFYFVAVAMGMALLVDMASYMMIAPLQRILESIICKRYWLEHDPSFIDPGGEVAEKYCKLAPIHKDLAKLRGWMDVAESLPGDVSLEI